MTPSKTPSDDKVARLYHRYRAKMGPSTPLREILQIMAEDLGVSVPSARDYLQLARKNKDIRKAGGVKWDEDEEKEMEQVFDALKKKHPDKSRMDIAEMVSHQLLPHRTEESIYQRYWQVKSKKGEILEGDMVGSYRTGFAFRRPKGYTEYRRQQDKEMIAKYANSTHCHDSWEDMDCLCYTKKISDAFSIQVGNRGVVRWEKRH